MIKRLLTVSSAMIKTGSYGLLVFAMVVLCVFSTPLTVYSLTSEQKKAIQSGARYFNTGEDNLTYCGTGPVPTGAIPDALAKSGLDPQWQTVITAAASENGVDPLIMAALLYQENHGWPPYRDGGWAANASRGSGPWQITSGTWPSSAGDYATNSQKVVESTKVAGQIAKSKEAFNGMKMGWITDDFGKNVKTQSIARAAINYNAGGATWRTPGVSDYKSAGRTWSQPAGVWPDTKQIIIDNYILGVVYLYYQISTGQTPTLNNLSSDAYAAEALTKKSEITGLSPSTGTTTTPTSPTTSTGKTVIAIDPGHGGEIKEYVDSVSGLADRETNNQPEGDDVMQVSLQVKAALEQAGYSVVMLRTTGQPVPNKRARVDMAAAAKANLVVSIHSTEEAINQVWPQRVGTYREYKGKKVSISNSAVAQLSQTYAAAVATARTTAEGHSVTLDPSNSQQASSFGRKELPSKGNVSLLQLWGQDIPWIYNEIDQDNGNALSSGMKQKHADGLVKGIQAALPASGLPGSPTTGTCGSSGSSAGFAGKVLEYAWPDYKNPTEGSRPPEMPGWTTAWQAADKAGRYVGGDDYRGIDCGGFVTTLLIDSGFDPTYNHGSLESQGAGYTVIQEAWLRANWTNLGNAGSIDPATLQPGDVAIKSGEGRSGHTYVYVGSIPGFNSTVASASLDERAPMAGRENPTNSEFDWFRKK